MKKHGMLLGLLVSLLWATSATAAPIVIDDNYWGGKDNGYGDVIGDISKFDIQRLEVTQTETSFVFNFFTNFAGQSGSHFQSYTQGNTGIVYGDLFLASSWNPFGSAADNYKLDNASTGTLWTYGLVLNNREGNSGGAVSLYALNGANNADNALLSDEVMKGNATWRNGQEVLVDTQSATTSYLGDIGTWVVGSGVVSLIVDLSLTNLLSGDTLAFHWDMTCGNDVIEGEFAITSVVEPGSWLLLGVGLLGLGLTRRRLRHKM
jgi:hypothetical protein